MSTLPPTESSGARRPDGRAVLTSNVDVRRYLTRLIAAIVVGVLLMAIVFVLAWSRWGPRPEDARPMPDRPPAGSPLR